MHIDLIGLCWDQVHHIWIVMIVILSVTACQKTHCEVVLWWHDSVITVEINSWQTNAVCSKYKAKPSKPRLAWYPILVVVKYCDHFGKANFRFSSLRRDNKDLKKKKNSLDKILKTKRNVMFCLRISTCQLIQQKYLSNIQWHKSLNKCVEKALKKALPQKWSLHYLSAWSVWSCISAILVSILCMPYLKCACICLRLVK